MNYEDSERLTTCEACSYSDRWCRRASIGSFARYLCFDCEILMEKAVRLFFNELATQRAMERVAGGKR